MSVTSFMRIYNIWFLIYVMLVTAVVGFIVYAIESHGEGNTQPERVDVACLDGTKITNVRYNTARNNLVVLTDTNNEISVISLHQCVLIKREK